MLFLEDAHRDACRDSSVAGSNCAVYVGISGLDYGIRSLDDLPSFSSHVMTGNTLSIAANRLSYVFDLHGPSLAIDTACSSSLVALHHACTSLRIGEASMAMVGGVNMLTHPYPFVGFTKASMLSGRGRCRTFDASGDGYVRAEGGAVLLLKPLDQAIAAGDRIHAVIRSSGANADGGRKTGLTIPSSQGQIELMRSVLQRSGLNPADVDYLEAHGTGTAIGDPIETSAIAEVYGKPRSISNPLPIGSVKTNVGHLEPASGMAGMVKALMVIKHRTVPPSIHLETPNPKIKFESWRLKPVTAPLALRQGNDQRPVVVGVNSFGFGGANAHVLLEEYLPDAASQVFVSDASVPPVIISARGEKALRVLASDYADLFATSPASAYDIAYAAHHHRDRLDDCLCVRGSSSGHLARALRAYAEGSPNPDVVVESVPAESGKIAFVYSGNGSQWAGMGQLLLAESPAFRSAIESLEAPMLAQTGFSILTRLQAEPAESGLDDTAIAQPLLFAIQYALTCMLRDEGVSADYFAGHSVGEVAAAWASGALSLDEAIQVIAARSAAQALTRGVGRMAAVSLSESAMRTLLTEHALDELEIAGINSPQNLTLSGPLAQLQQLGALARERSIVFRLLDLDYAFHSAAMDSVRDGLARSLVDFSPSPPQNNAFVSTVTGAVLNAPLDADYWWQNVRLPVRFADAMQTMVRQGCRVFVEIGPHAILQRYIKECLDGSESKGRVLPSLRKHDDGEDVLQAFISRLYLLGDKARLDRFFPTPGQHVDLPHYPWQRERHWLPNSSEGYRLIERHRVHPLLGWRLKETPFAWENILDPALQPWLNDHQVGGAIVLPGAAYVEMALAAGREWLGVSALALEQLDIVSPVVFDGEHGRSTRLEINVRDGGFEIRSRQRLSEDEWSLNAAGRLLGSPILDRPITPIDPVLVGDIAVDRDTHYRLANALGLDYGPTFQRLQSARLAGDVLEGFFDLDKEGSVADASWLLPPNQLDVCFQSLLNFFQVEIESGVGMPLLPVKIGQLSRLSDMPAVMFRARLLRRSMRSVLADFELLAADGSPVALLAACRFRAASLGQSHQTKAPSVWEIVPRLQPNATASAITMLPEVRVINQALRTLGLARGDQDSDNYTAEVQPLLDALVAALAYQAMGQVLAGIPAQVQSWLSEGKGLNPAHASLFGWVANLLQDQGWLTCLDDRWTLGESGLPPAADIWRTLMSEHPSALQELVLIGHQGQALGAVLAGDRDAVEFARYLSASHQFETLFDDSLSYQRSRQSAIDLVQSLLESSQPNRRLRILEVAGGFSSLPLALATCVDTSRLDYCLAHPDADAVDYLRHEYHTHAWVDVAELDEATFKLKSAAMLPEVFDLVIVRHAMWKVADPVQWLRLAQKCMAADGVLALFERHPDLSGEFLFGPGRLQSPASWVQLLDQVGFVDSEVSLDPAVGVSLVGGFAVLAKRAALEQLPTKEPARWLLLTRDAASHNFAVACQDALIAAGQIVLLGKYSGLPTCAAAVDLLQRHEIDFAGHVENVVLLPAKSAPGDGTPAIELLNLVHALSLECPEVQLTVVTQGGALLDGLIPAAMINPAQAACWGFGRVVMNEYPALGMRLVDLGLTDPSTAASLLSQELLHPDGEGEVVLRDETRHVLRMQKSAMRLPGAQEKIPSRYRLDFRVPGQLRNLLWLEQPQIDLGPEDIEVRPMATGLNFRDVMYVMGLLPDEAVEHGFAGASLGLEFSGVVTRVGQRVDEFAPGDAVMGFGAACFASHVVTRSSAVMAKPEAWTFEAAATVPTVFFTVITPSSNWPVCSRVSVSSFMARPVALVLPLFSWRVIWAPKYSPPLAVTKSAALSNCSVRTMFSTRAISLLRMKSC
jgi:phthiocerol/phenolphthiocerol synthesis type-I polyketide synthase C